MRTHAVPASPAQTEGDHDNDQKPATCDKCDRSFSSHVGLNNHIRSQHPEMKTKRVEPTIMKCQICGQEFDKPSRLANHLARHKQVEYCKTVNISMQET